MPKLKNGDIPQVLATEYASYRDGVIRALSLKLADAEHLRSRPLILYDPMAGTAPLLSLAERRGYTAYLNDLNSIHLFVNAAKTFKSYQMFNKIGPNRLLSLVCRMASKIDQCPRTASVEWIERPVLEKLTLAWRRSEEEEDLTTILIKAILKLSIRKFASFIKTKNPTWLKPGGLRPKISAEEAFRDAIKRLEAFYQCVYPRQRKIQGGHIILTDYDASKESPKCKVDVVMTSPPFCNRVDWDRIYAPEHFFLNAVGVWHTRTKFLGTTAVRQYSEFDSEFEFVTKRSPYLGKFLTEVQKRQPKEERGSNYYVKYFTRYFCSLFRVFDVAASSLGRANAGIYFVVQENTHRGLRIETNKALRDFLSKQGFHVRHVREWDRHHMGLQNISRHYRLVSPKQREAIWHAVR